MNKSLRMVLALSLFTSAASAFAIACSDDDTGGTPTTDAGPDSTTEAGADTGTPDSGLPDTAAPDTGPKECPIMNDPNASIGGPTCNTCVANNCCDVLTKCIQGDVDGSVEQSDGGLPECYLRLGCLYENNCGNAADAGGCDKQCAAGFSNATNALAAPAIACLFGTDFGKPTTGCSKREDGGPLCVPEP